MIIVVTENRIQLGGGGDYIAKEMVEIISHGVCLETGDRVPLPRVEVQKANFIEWHQEHGWVLKEGL